MIEIWGRINSINVQKVMWVAAELDLDWQRHDVGGPWGGTSEPGFVSMNPNRLVPVMRAEETVLWESNSCVRYLAARYGSNVLWPEEPAARGRADMWMDWMLTTLNQPLRDVFFQMVRTHPDRRDLKMVQAGIRQLGELFGILDRHLEGTHYVAGEDLTMGDVPVGCATYRYFSLNIARPELPALESWYWRLAERPAFRRHVMVPLT